MKSSVISPADSERECAGGLARGSAASPSPAGRGTDLRTLRGDGRGDADVDAGGSDADAGAGVGGHAGAASGCGRQRAAAARAAGAGASWRWLALAWLAAAAVVVARSWDAFAQPILFAEDGTVLFAGFAGGDRSVFAPYAGYVALLPNLAGWAAALLPLELRPHALSAFAGALACTAFAVFASGRFAHVLPSAPQRAVVCLLLALLPLGSFRLVSAAMYSIWSTLLAAALLALARPPRRGAAMCVEVLLLALCLWSHPISAALLPVYGWRAWRARRGAERGYFAALAFCVVLYQLVGVEHGSRLAPAPAAVARGAAALLGERVCVEPWLGLSGKLWLFGSGLRWCVWGVALGAVAALAAALRRAPPPARRFGGAALGLAAVLSLAIAAGTPNPTGPGGEWGQRYAYVQGLLCYLAAVVAVLSRCRGGAVRLAALLLLLHAVALNAHNRDYYATSADEGAELRAFCAAAARWRSDPDGSGPEQLRLYRHGWSIALPRGGR